MIERCLEVLFRHKLLLFLPPILIPLIVGPVAVLRAPAYYETWTGIWVDRPTYITYVDEWSRYNSPAHNQSARLAELLRTRAFLLDVANQTVLAPLLDSTQGEEQVQRFIGRGLAFAPSGNNLLTLRFRAPTPQLSFQVVNALVSAFKEKAVTDRVTQAGLAISFYEGRLQTAEEELTKANESLRRYVASSPRLAALDATRGSAAAQLPVPVSALDPQLTEMMRRVDLEQTEMARIRTTLEQARLDAAASLEGQELGFQIVDPPRVADRPTRERRKALLYPAAGLVVGLGLSATLLVLLVAGDRTIRSESELAAMARVLGTVPRLHVARLPKRAGPDTTRRAVGFAAGTTLPALAGPAGAR
jgi:uncharacterized protein involved in exopolysaccharide biosynthesis